MSDRHTAIYVRVSSKTQDTRSQEPDLERWAAGRDGPVVWYRDRFTGRTLARPGWTKVMAAVSDGRCAAVAVWRLDRLGRTARELTALFEDLMARGVALVSLREGFDLSTPGGRLFANMLASVAQYETEVRSERQLAGIAAAKARGVKFGRPRGQGATPGKRLRVTTEQDALIRRLKAEGSTVAAIARATGLSRPTVYSVLAGAG